MIVEDENIVALDMKYRLEAFGYTVCAVLASGEVAVAEVAVLKPDLVLMDIHLKGSIDGVESARLIRNKSRIPIVFVTAFTDDATLERVKASEAYGYIVKPYHERELQIAIELVLSKQRYEQELCIAKEAAEASDRAKTRFLSNISHELKTPLNSIIGFLDLVATTKDADEIDEYLMHVAQGARKLETMIDSILDYTKLEFGALAPIHSEFELEQFLVDCWMPFTSDASAKGIAARLYIDPDLPKYIFGDAGKLKIIIRNLLDNAVKFTDAGHVLLSADCVKESGESLLKLRVSDTGAGIPKERLSAAFALFTQIDDSTTRAAGGMGLGLPLTKALADLLQVHMECTSKAESGTEFTISLELPPDCVPAWPVQSHERCRHIGMYGNPYASHELMRWAPRFKLEFHQLGDDGEELESCEAIVADCTAFFDAQPAVQAALSGICNGKLLLIGGRCGRNIISDKNDYIRLPSPPSLGAFIKSMDALLGSESANIENPGSRDEGVSIKTIDRNYDKLVHSAQLEAEAMSIQGELVELLSKLVSDLAEKDLTDTERLAKTFHNRFSDVGANACAKLALAVSMDIRNGLGQELCSVLATLSFSIRG
jgi:signal transduction histidine kinase